VLNSQSQTTNNSFAAVGLALVIDQQLRRAGLDGLSENMIEELSGERFIQTQRKLIIK
jgi:hypothetical protein